MKRIMNRYDSVHLFIKGGSRGNPGPSAIGIVITHGKNEEIQVDAKIIKDGTNNVATYKALIRGLNLCRKLTSGTVVCVSDSMLMVNQITRKYQTRNARLARLAEKARILLSDFEEPILTYAPSSEPRLRQANRLLRMALATLPGEADRSIRLLG